MSFYTETIEKSPKFMSIAQVRDLNLLEPGFRSDVLAFITDAKALGRQLFVAETYRSVERQMHLANEGLTELRHVGVHHYGLAVDLGLSVAGHYDPRGQDYSFFVGLARKHRIVSGINWGEPSTSHSFHDWDHVQRIPLHRQAALFAGTWFPPSDYDPYQDGAS